MEQNRSNDTFVLTHASIVAFEKQARLERHRYLASVTRAGTRRLRETMTRLAEAVGSHSGEAREA